MVELVCPTCASSTTVGRRGADVKCPSCGSALLRRDGFGLCDAYPSNDALISDLREAFDSCDFRLGPESAPGVKGRVDGSAGESGHSAPIPLSPGHRLGDFEILSEIGRGGMGIVYRARQISLDRDVALKVLPGATGRGRSSLRRFRTEAQAIARLNHPHIVRVHAQGECDSYLYYAMELVEGVSLDQVIYRWPETLGATWLRSGLPADTTGDGKNEVSSAAGGDIDGSDRFLPLAWPCGRRTSQDFRYLARLIAGAADGLAHAHENKVVHRDVKPHNLLLTQDDRLHITDFGLAYLTDEPHLTVTGEVMGTPAYLSPEQVRGDVGAIDHRTDVYSLGATLYELIARRRPFTGETRAQILTQIGEARPARPRQWDTRIPIDLETICLRALEKSPDRRYSSAAAMAEDLRRFAESRPILSRPIGPLGRTVRWVRRRKFVAATIASAAAVLILAGGLFSVVKAGRQSEANRLVRGAYEHLAYRDYKDRELVAADIDRGEALGADRASLHLVQALADMGDHDETGARQHLQAILEEDPTEVTAIYILAWAQWRQRELQASRATVKRAEQLGGPDSAVAHFLRGLAIHSDQPDLAIESYREAIALRAQKHEFYPQAVVHLARAYNQRMYASRSADGFQDVEAELLQLIEHQHYDAYPYYLLSIAHRLVGEIERAKVNGDDTVVIYHFEESLAVAQDGQVAAPTDDRPVAAEAETLERTGRLYDAIDARTRAIELAKRERARCENYHYRWRLYYWVDELDAALEDVDAHAACIPESLLYAHVYPALIYAEEGDMLSALEEVRAVAEDAPGDAQAIIWSATALRLLGNSTEADELLAASKGDLVFDAGLESPQTAEWVAALYEFCAGERDLEDLLALAGGASVPRKLYAELYFHAAAKALAEGSRADASRWFQEAHQSFDSALRYTFHAQVILEKLEADPDWPPWISGRPDDEKAVRMETLRGDR